MQWLAKWKDVQLQRRCRAQREPSQTSLGTPARGAAVFSRWSSWPRAGYGPLLKAQAAEVRAGGRAEQSAVAGLRAAREPQRARRAGPGGARAGWPLRAGAADGGRVEPAAGTAAGRAEGHGHGSALFSGSCWASCWPRVLRSQSLWAGGGIPVPRDASQGSWRRSPAVREAMRAGRSSGLIARSRRASRETRTFSSWES